MEEIQTNTLVLGGGPAGYAAAIRLGQLGVDCVIIEKDKMGGTCLNVGCIPSKALLHASSSYKNALHEFPQIGLKIEKPELDWSQTIRWKDDLVAKLVSGVESLLKANKVKIVTGEGTITNLNEAEVSGKTKVRFDHLILAAGSGIVELPAFPFSEKNIVNSTDLLAMTEIPSSMIILGGGIIGMELGTVFASINSDVTIIEMMDRILPTYEAEAVALVEKSFKKLGGKILCGAKAVSYKTKAKGQIELTYEKDGKQNLIAAEKLAVAVGRKSNLGSFQALDLTMDKNRIVVNERLQTNYPHIYAIGDLIDGPMLAHKGSSEGVLAAEAIVGRKVSRDDIHAMPDVVYTKPEIASVGINQDDAKNRGLKVKVGKFPLKALGRAFTTNELEGYIKYIAEEETDQIIGVTIVSNRASDLIGEATLALEMKATLEDVALSVHPHPSFSEAHMESAAAALKNAIHIINR